MMRRLVAALGLLAATGCAYYNAMWSAERLAKQARRAEATGADVEARGLWGRAAVKAESVVVRHPRSRWADDAAVLRAEALVRAGRCAHAAAPIARARALTLADDLRERVDLAVAECFVREVRLRDAAALLTPLLESHDADRRARATYLAGQAAWAQGDGPNAAALLARSSLPDAGAARVHVLLGSGRVPEALALLDSLAAQRFREAQWVVLLDSTAATAGPAAASGALDRLLQRGRVPQDAAARLLMHDGDRRAAARQMPEASARYAAAAATVPDAAGAEVAQMRRLRALAAGAETMADLDPLWDALARARAGTADHRGLTMAMNQIRQRDTDIQAFRAAELVRDSIYAVRLAGSLFMDIARRWPASVFAPKAIVAAMTLLPEQRDSLGDVLSEAYGQSPYAIALRGEAAPAFPAAEDSLARALGIQLSVEGGATGSVRVAPPTPGRRTVWLDPPGATASSTPPPRRAPNVVPARPQQRPAERPDERP